VVRVCDVYAARETPIPGITGELVANAARTSGAADVYYTPTLAELHAALSAGLRAGDVLVAMGAGDIDEMTNALFATLQREAGT
jgi:UDP-N-acetylmuramate--alanine ligase